MTLLNRTIARKLAAYGYARAVRLTPSGDMVKALQ